MGLKDIQETTIKHKVIRSTYLLCIEFYQNIIENWPDAKSKIFLTAKSFTFRSL